MVTRDDLIWTEPLYHAPSGQTKAAIAVRSMEDIYVLYDYDLAQEDDLVAIDRDALMAGTLDSSIAGMNIVLPDDRISAGSVNAYVVQHQTTFFGDLKYYQELNEDPSINAFWFGVLAVKFATWFGTLGLLGKILAVLMVFSLIVVATLAFMAVLGAIRKLYSADVNCWTDSTGKKICAITDMFGRTVIVGEDGTVTPTGIDWMTAVLIGLGLLAVVIVGELAFTGKSSIAEGVGGVMGGVGGVMGGTGEFFGGVGSGGGGGGGVRTEDYGVESVNGGGGRSRGREWGERTGKTIRRTAHGAKEYGAGVYKGLRTPTRRKIRGLRG